MTTDIFATLPKTRLQSQVLTRYPWITDVVVSNLDYSEYFGENHFLVKFLTSLDNLEKDILRGYTLSSINLRRFLRFQHDNDSDTYTPHDSDTYTPHSDKAATTACLTYLCANRLVDIVAWLEGRPQILAVPMHKRQIDVGINGNVNSKGWNYMENWAKLLTDFHSLFNKHQDQARNSNSVESSPLSGENRCFSLLASIVQRNDTLKTTKIYSNIETVAFLIAVMLRGLHDLPANVDWFSKEENWKFVDADNKSLEFLERMYKQSIHRFKLPLQLALMISPLYLLVPLQLHSKDWDRYTLLLTSKAFGNQKPASLLVVEKVIWTALFRIARGEITSEEGIDIILGQVTPDYIKGIDATESVWFSQSRDKEATKLAALKLHEFDVEGDISVDWPLMTRQLVNPALGPPTTPSSPAGARVNTDSTSSSVVSAAPAPGPPTIPSAQVSTPRPSPGPSTPRPSPGPPTTPSSPAQTRVNVNTASTPSSSLSITSLRLPTTPSPVPVTTPQPSPGPPATPSTPSPAGTTKPTESFQVQSPQSPLRRSTRNGSNKTAPIDYSGLQTSTTPWKNKTRRNKHNKPLAPGQEDPPVTSEESESESGSASESEESPKPEASELEAEETPGDPEPLKPGQGDNDIRPTAMNTQLLRGVGSSPETPITLEIIELVTSLQQAPPPTLNISKDRSTTIFESPPEIVYSPFGEEVSISMYFHSKTKLTQFTDLMDGIKSFYIAGTPLHMFPDQSSILVIPLSTSTAGGVQGCQSILGRQHLLITHLAIEPMSFNEAGLETIKSIDTVIDIYDYSYHLGEFVTDDSLYLKTGSLSQILESTQLFRNPPIMATTEIPLGVLGLINSSFSSEFYAWRRTEGLPFCNKLFSIPADALRWGSVSTKGSLSGWQLAPNGFGHYIDVKVGSLYLVLAKPKDSDNRFSNIDLFTNNFQPHEPNTGIWDLEGVVLTPGTRMILRPNTPYRLLFLEHTICHGGRFYATSTLQDTVVGLMHGFINPSLTGNKSYPEPSRQLLRRMTFYFHSKMNSPKPDQPGNQSQGTFLHMPDLSDTKQAFDLLTMYIMMVLLNVLDPETYEYPDIGLISRDQNRIPLIERTASMYARGKAESILHTLFARFHFVDSATGSIYEQPFKQIILTHLICLESTLLKYKEMTLHNQSLSTVSCTQTRLNGQLHQALCRFPDYNTIRSRFESDLAKGKVKLESLGWDYSRVRIVPRPAPAQEIIVQPSREFDYISLGTTGADARYKAYHKLPEELTYSALAFGPDTIDASGTLKRQLLGGTQAQSKKRRSK